MDTLYKILAVAIITCIACLIVKPVRSDFAIFISIVGGIIVIFYTLSYLSNIFDVFNQIFQTSGINSSLYGVVFKIIGIGYLTEFTAGLCNDTGNSSLADKVLLGGKIVILAMALPIVTSILDIVMELLPK
ncbi:MAG: stage III sporulation protein AD [Candidatus Caccovivens sp.]